MDFYNGYKFIWKVLEKTILFSGNIFRSNTAIDVKQYNV